MQSAPGPKGMSGALRGWASADGAGDRHRRAARHRAADLRAVSGRPRLHQRHRCDQAELRDGALLAADLHDVPCAGLAGGHGPDRPAACHGAGPADLPHQLGRLCPHLRSARAHVGGRNSNGRATSRPGTGATSRNTRCSFVATVPAVLHVPAIASETCALVGYGWALWLEWFVTRLVLNLSPTAAALLVAVDVGFSAIVSLVTLIPWQSLSIG